MAHGLGDYRKKGQEYWVRGGEGQRSLGGVPGPILPFETVQADSNGRELPNKKGSGRQEKAAGWWTGSSLARGCSKTHHCLHIPGFCQFPPSELDCDVCWTKLPA